MNSPWTIGISMVLGVIIGIISGLNMGVGLSMGHGSVEACKMLRFSMLVCEQGDTDVR